MRRIEAEDKENITRGGDAIITPLTFDRDFFTNVEGQDDEKQGPAGQRCVRMALKRHKGIKKGIKRPKALKGNDRIGLMKLFRAFFTKALQKHY